MTFPIAILFAPFNDALSDTASSGALVPKDTIVNPMINGGIENFWASAAEPSTKISAPFTKKTNPTIININHYTQPYQLFKKQKSTKKQKQ